MFDILLNKEGDIELSDTGTFLHTQSVKQSILIHLRWFFDEWRLGPELGFPWFEEVFVKNPNILKLKGLIRDEIKKVEGVTSAQVNDISFDKASRKAKVTYTCTVGEDTFREEVDLYGRN